MRCSNARTQGPLRLKDCLVYRARSSARADELTDEELLDITEVLRAGDSAGFPAGDADGHTLHACVDRRGKVVGELQAEEDLPRYLRLIAAS